MIISAKEVNEANLLSMNGSGKKLVYLTDLESSNICLKIEHPDIIRGADGSKSNCFQISRTIASRIKIPVEMKSPSEIDITKSKNWLPKVKYMSTRID